MTTNSRLDVQDAGADYRYQGDLRQELGIEEQYDGSPHRFFDWQRDQLGGDGAIESDSYLSIQD